MSDKNIKTPIPDTNMNTKHNTKHQHKHVMSDKNIENQ